MKKTKDWRKVTLGMYEEDGYELSNLRQAPTGLNGTVATIQAKRYNKIDEKMEYFVILIVINNKTQIETIIPKEAWQEINAVRI